MSDDKDNKGNQPELLSDETVFRGARFDLHSVSVDIPRLDGDGMRQSSYDVAYINQTAAILPYDPKLDQFVLIRQFRIGSHLRDGTKFITEIPGGIIDEGDDSPIVGATRELREETGLTPVKLHALTSYYPANWMSTQKAHLFLAIIDSADIDSYGVLDAEDEDLEIITLTRKRAKEKLLNGEFIHDGTIMALSHFFLMEDKYRP